MVDQVEQTSDMSPYDIKGLFELSNVAETLSEEQLEKIGRTVVEEYLIDEQSRSEWLKHNEGWMKLALQVYETKNTPWPKASNIKYPLLTTASIQFAARAYPALVKNPNMVKAKIVGDDDDNGSKATSAKRISQHMSYQVLDEMEEWEEDMDKLTIIVPISGCVFKKTYRSSAKKRNVSELVYARDLCINYYASSVDTALRITHILELYPNDLHERITRGDYREVELTTNINSDYSKIIESRKIRDKVNGTSAPNDKPENTPRIILEQHRTLDLDNDGYAEPYIVTVDFQTKKVLRIVARYDLEGIETTEDNKIICIKPTQYFTKFSFIPNPDGGIYDVGFGILLGPLNETVNTLMNLLVDAGILSNQQSGFIARGLRIQGGNKRFIPGEWKIVNSTGQDLRNGIYPLPANEPSQVLFALLGLILQSGEKLSSIVDSMTGENPGQNQKATTTLAVIEQGLKVFTAIHKRLYRSLTSEFKKLYRLNSIYLDPQEYFEVLDDDSADAATIYLQDYRSGHINVKPAADPNIATELQRIIKANALMEMMAAGLPLNVQEVTLRNLEAQDQPNIKALMTMPEAQPSFEEQIELQKLELLKRELDIKDKVAQNEAIKDDAVAILSLAKAEKETVVSSLQELKTHVESMRHAVDAVTKLNPPTPIQE